MNDKDPIARIDRALGRIEAAAAQQREARHVVERRHDTLRGHVADAVAALDAMIGGAR